MTVLSQLLSLSYSLSVRLSPSLSLPFSLSLASAAFVHLCSSLQPRCSTLWHHCASRYLIHWQRITARIKSLFFPSLLLRHFLMFFLFFWKLWSTYMGTGECHRLHPHGWVAGEEVCCLYNWKRSVSVGAAGQPGLQQIRLAVILAADWGSLPPHHLETIRVNNGLPPRPPPPAKIPFSSPQFLYSLDTFIGIHQNLGFCQFFHTAPSSPASFSHWSFALFNRTSDLGGNRCVCATC